MISIKKYLNRPSSSEDTLRRVLTLLMQAIELHTVEGDADDYRRFRSSMQIALTGFGPESTADQLLVMAGAVTTAVREYSERTSRFIRTQVAEYHRIVHLLTETVSHCAQGDERALGRLKSLEEQLQRAAQVEDVRELRIELGHCLASLQASVQEQKEEAAKAERLRAAVDAVCRPVVQEEPRREGQARGSGNFDLLTQELVREAVGNRPRDRLQYVLVLVVDKFAALQTRFGPELADRILWLLKRDVKRRLNDQDRLYRWHGAVFVGLLSRDYRLAEVSAEMARAVSSKFEEHVEVGQRSILLTASVNWTVFPMEGPDGEILRKIDEFAGRHSGRGNGSGAFAGARPR
ncbi:MAG: diguanylate cyclase [Bryobacterales bacterium]|nr:diguanylate cyclase [Bryobacterales bacterium]